VVISVVLSETVGLLTTMSQLRAIQGRIGPA
jgi:hypothetical protein